MRTLEYLGDPSLAPIYRPIILAALAVAIICGSLSVFVVLKRLVFMGQGISHAAFGGVGVAFLLGVTGSGFAGGFGEELALFLIVLGFCVLAGMAIARLSARQADRPDSAIGIVLVGSMALGFVFLRLAAERAAARGLPPPPSVEGVLFGSFASVGRHDAALAWVAAAGVVGAMVALRRRLLFWAFDEPAALAFGVRTSLLRTVVMLLLALAIVITLRLAGVILATALLVMPGVTALRMSSRLAPVLALSMGVSLAGVLGGLVVSFEADLQPGPSVVLVLIVLLALAALAERLRAASRRGGIESTRDAAGSAAGASEGSRT